MHIGCSRSWAQMCSGGQSAIELQYIGSKENAQLEATRMEQTGRTNKLSYSRRELKEDAPYENECQYMCLFEKLLKENMSDIQLVSDEEYEEDCELMWSEMVCQKCQVHFDTTQLFLEHILSCQFTRNDMFCYEKYGIVTKEIQDVLNEASEDRASRSYLSKSLANDDEIKIMIPMTSPLATFFLRGIMIYLERFPADNKRVIRAKIEQEGKAYTLFFTAKMIQKQYDDYAKHKDKQQKLRVQRELTRACQTFKLSCPDVVLHSKHRPAEVTRDLAIALGISRKIKLTQEVIMAAFEEKFKKNEESSKSTSPVETPILRNHKSDESSDTLDDSENSPESEKLKLNSGEIKNITVADNWLQGQIWAQTGCDENMNCETGSYSLEKNEICSKNRPFPPVTIAEFTLKGANDEDFYDVSLVNGYNVPITIETIGGTGNNCGKSGECVQDLNEICPDEFAVRRDNLTIGCKTSCLIHQNDEECCENQYANFESCSLTKTSKLFKNSCPGTYSFEFDDVQSTFTCIGANYFIKFC
ncbi:unnamed protein product [Caenorhabditis angaria]|uniref:Uncharacterized protein n=1 Tax=Caenorhabditis angaria TaxID=860376 RepID=A0A9P1N3E2_9PELO|nr:unnamed protein product [Caenorhabditis angaria]